MTELALWDGVLPVIRRAARFDWHRELILELLRHPGVLGIVLRRRYRRAADRWGRSLALGGLVALVGTAVQGIGNYNLPVMSSWVYLATVLALALGAEGAAGDPGRHGAEAPGGRDALAAELS